MTLSFRTYLNLESLKKNLVEGAEGSEFPDKLFAYLSAASVPFNEKDEWKTPCFVFLKAVSELKPNQDLPFIKDTPKEGGKPASWDYEGRTWFYLSHLLAQAYGWTVEYIGNLDVNDALAYIQEILTDAQLDREFEYSLSEVAYPYNKSTKRSVYKPMPRPYWMKVAVQPLKKYKYPRSLLPMGVIQDISGMPSEFNPLRNEIIQEKPKEINPPPNP